MLTEKNKRFVEEYILTYNGTQSYMKAYGCSYDTAMKSAAGLLKKTEVKQYLAQLQKENAERWGSMADVIIKELSEDIVARDENGKHSASWQKSVDLLQKQLGLQKQNLSAQVEAKNEIQINIGD